MYQNLWDAAKAVLRGKFIELNIHIRKEQRAKINNNLSIHCRRPEKGEQFKSKIEEKK